MDTNFVEGSGYNYSDANDTYQSLCASRALDNSFSFPLSSAGLAAVRSLQFLYVFIILSVGGILNSAILWAILKRKHLWTINITISLQIVSVSMITLPLVLLPALFNAAAGKWLFGAYACSMLGFAESVIRTVRKSLMVALALDRFLLVYKPFKYPQYQSRALLLFSAVSWVGTIIFRIAGLPGILDCYGPSSNIMFCVFRVPCSPSCFIFGYTDFAVVHAPFYILPTVFFLALYIKGKKMNSFPTVPANVTNSGSSNKSTITILLLFVTSCACYLPNFGSVIVLQIIVAVKGYSATIGSLFFIVTHSVILLVVVDPIVILRNRDIKEAVLEDLKNILRRIYSRRA